ncbi:MAG: hypothetical protein ACP6IY_06340 [Promethearchaeia archaeon]
MSNEFVVYRYVNVFYYILFSVFILLVLIYLIPKRKEEPYKTAFKVFYTTSIVLIAMEIFGTFSGAIFGRPIRVFYFNGENIIVYQILCQIIMGLGEGGASTSLMFLMVDSIYQGQIKRFFKYLLAFSILIFSFTFFTFIYKTGI